MSLSPNRKACVESSLPVILKSNVARRDQIGQLVCPADQAEDQPLPDGKADGKEAKMPNSVWPTEYTSREPCAARLKICDDDPADGVRR
jgi:hypothetical protein